TKPVILPGDLSFSTTDPGAFTFTPSVVPPIAYKGPITFTLFVGDSTTHTTTAQSITIDNTKNGVTFGTGTATSDATSPTSLADLETTLAGLDTTYANAVADRQAARAADNAALVAQNEALMAAIQQVRASAVDSFVGGVIAGSIIL